VGAGIGGLSAGLALRKAGLTIRIFERSPSPRELGFGLALAPNAIAALRTLGVADVVTARSFEPRRAEVRRPDGTVLKRAELPPEVLGGPMIIALRPALHGALLEAVGVDAVALENDVTGFTSTGTRVTLQMAGGGVADGDVLIGADGVGSVVRRAMHPDEAPPRSSGIVAVRGAVHGALRHLGDLHAVYYLGRGVESMFVRASDTGIYWFLSMARALVPAGMQDPRAILALMSPRFDSTFRAVTSATDDLRFDELVDRDSIPFWGKDAVRTRAPEQDRDVAPARAPDGAHHGDDESVGVLRSRSSRADDSSQAVREILREDQSPRGYGRESIMNRLG